MLALGGLGAGLAGWLAQGAAAQTGGTQFAPVAMADVVSVETDPATGTTVVELDGSRSFDPEGRIASYKWEVVTDAYSGFPIAASPKDGDVPAGRTATFTLLGRALEAVGEHTVEFRLTVADDGFPALTSSATAAADINRGPTAAIAVTAWLPAPRGEQFGGYDDDGDGAEDENDERYTLQGVIHGPGEHGNADNEWDVREGSLLVVDGSSSFDPDGPLPDSAFRWERIYATDLEAVTATLPGDTDGQRALSTDEDPNTPGRVPSETVGRLPAVLGGLADPYYLYYRLTVTDDRGASHSAVAKIVIRDAHHGPTVAIVHPEPDPSAATEAARRAGVRPAGEDRYVISPDAAENGVALTAVGTGDGPGRTAALEHTWSGSGVEPAESNRPGAATNAVFTAPEGTREGDAFTVEVQVADQSGFTGATSVELVVADNAPPQAAAPDDFDTADGADGGWPPSDPPTGTVVLEGFGFDPDGGPLGYRWEQVLNRFGRPLTVAYRGPRVHLSGADTATASFRLPEVAVGDRYTVHVQLTVTDQWGVAAADITTITIHDGDDDLQAVAGTPWQADPGEFVQLVGRISSGLISADAIAAVTYQWAYKGIDTHPRAENRPPITAAEAAYGYTPGEWLPNADGTYHPTAGGRVRLIGGRYPYFFAPDLGGFDSVTLAFELTVASGTETDTDTVTVTIAGRFFSGAVDGPEYCARLSLGGPATRPHDSDKDGIADVCSLPTTRRAAIARQHALETLAALWPEALADALHGPPDNPDTPNADESDPARGTCRTAPDDLPGDTPEALASDACAPKNAAERLIAPPPKPVDPAKAGRFYSSRIYGPEFCADHGLGGPRLYAHDSDGDGAADVCALPHTRREAAARQQALENAFGNHPQYAAALAAACRALGTLGFGGHPEDLAQDHCSKPPSTTERGLPLPAPTRP